MDKVYVGHMFDVPKDHEEKGRIGGYPITTHDGNLMICGFTEFNLSQAPILITSMSPMTGKYLNETMNEEGKLGTVYDVEDTWQGFMVSYGEHNTEEGVRGYLFSNFDDAILFLSTIVQFKASGLKGVTNG